MFRYIDHVLSLKIMKVSDYIDRIYFIELETKDTTDTTRYVSCLDLHLAMDSRRFHIVN